MAILVWSTKNNFFCCFCFIETLIRNQRRSARSGDLRIHGTVLTDNQVLIWKFNRLDKNRDKLLVSSEFLTPPMKKYLGNIKRGRKCGKKLLNDCDRDKDRGLSMAEWTICLGTSRRMPLQWLWWSGIEMKIQWSIQEPKEQNRSLNCAYSLGVTLLEMALKGDHCHWTAENLSKLCTCTSLFRGYNSKADRAIS